MVGLIAANQSSDVKIQVYDLQQTLANGVAMKTKRIWLLTALFASGTAITATLLRSTSSAENVEQPAPASFAAQSDISQSDSSQSSSSQPDSFQSTTAAPPGMRPVVETKTKLINYTVMKPVYEKHVNEVQYTVMKPVYETKERVITYTTCTMVPETKTKTVEYTTCRMVPEARQKTVEYQEVRYVPIEVSKVEAK